MHIWLVAEQRQHLMRGPDRCLRAVMIYEAIVVLNNNLMTFWLS